MSLPTYSKENYQPTASSVEELDSAIDDILPFFHQYKDELLKYAEVHRLRLAFDLDLVKKHAGPNVEILEAGSFPPFLTLALRRSSFSVTGVDIAPERMKDLFESLGITIIKCDIEREKLPLPDKSVDIVLFNEMFEHLRINPIFTLSEILRVLRPGGKLFLSTPNARSIYGIQSFLRFGHTSWCCPDIYQQYDKLDKLGHMGHVREYTPQEILEFISKIGFVPLQILYRGMPSTVLSKLIVRFFPSLRPFFSLIASAPQKT